MTSMFMQTMTKAIADYRQILRRYLGPQARADKIKQLRLKDPGVFKSEALLYQVGVAIINDIHNNINVPNEGYYSYHGITKFSQYLEEYLSHYELDGRKIMHKAQKAANAMIKVIQIFAMDDSLLDDEVVHELSECSQVIANCGSKDQQKLYRSALERQCEHAPGLYQDILKHYDAYCEKRSSSSHTLSS